MLKKTAEVSEVQCVKSANVPLMRFKFRGISIDLLYARLSLRTIPEDMNILDEKLLEDLDDTTVKSLNGCRWLSCFHYYNSSSFKEVFLWSSRQEV
jgi:poly(A) polymerase